MGPSGCGPVAAARSTSSAAAVAAASPVAETHFSDHSRRRLRRQGHRRSPLARRRARAQLLGVRREEHRRIAEERVVGLRLRERELDRRDAELEALERDPARALDERRRIPLEQIEGPPVPQTPSVRHQLAKRVAIGAGVGREHAALAESTVGELDRGPQGLRGRPRRWPARARAARCFVSSGSLSLSAAFPTTASRSPGAPSVS